MNMTDTKGVCKIFIMVMTCVCGSGVWNPLINKSDTIQARGIDVFENGVAL